MTATAATFVGMATRVGHALLAPWGRLAGWLDGDLVCFVCWFRAVLMPLPLGWGSSGAWLVDALCTPLQPGWGRGNGGGEGGSAWYIFLFFFDVGDRIDSPLSVPDDPGLSYRLAGLKRNNKIFPLKMWLFFYLGAITLTLHCIGKMWSTKIIIDLRRILKI